MRAAVRVSEHPQTRPDHENLVPEGRDDEPTGGHQIGGVRDVETFRNTCFYSNVHAASSSSLEHTACRMQLRLHV